MKLNPNWKWFFEAPLSATWRSRLELCFGVVVSTAAVVAMSSSIRPDPSKLAKTQGTALESRVVDSAPPPPPALPILTTEFSNAVSAGDLVAMTRHYRPGMPLGGMLSMAARSGSKDAVLWLLRRGADVHDEEYSPYGPILSADARPEITTLLRARGAKEPTLEAAATANAPNAVMRILATNPNVNASASYPLQAAATSTNGSLVNKRRIIKWLVDKGADPNRTWSGGTALAGVIADCDRLEDDAGECMTTVQLLLDHGAKVTGDALGAALSLEDVSRATLLDALLARPLDKGVTASALATAWRVDPTDLKRIVAKGVDWRWQDGEEEEALPVMAAVRRGDRDLLRLLLDAGAPVDVHYKDASSALGEAIDRSANYPVQQRIVELLVTRGADVNRRLPDGRTPLFAAAEAGDLRVVHFLLARGARVNEVVLDDTALDIADQHGNVSVARVLHAHGGHRLRPQYPMYR